MSLAADALEVAGASLAGLSEHEAANNPGSLAIALNTFGERLVQAADMLFQGAPSSQVGLAADALRKAGAAMAGLDPDNDANLRSLVLALNGLGERVVQAADFLADTELQEAGAALAGLRADDDADPEFLVLNLKLLGEGLMVVADTLRRS